MLAGGKVEGADDWAALLVAVVMRDVWTADCDDVPGIVGTV